MYFYFETVVMALFETAGYYYYYYYYCELQGYGTAAQWFLH